MKRTLGDRLAQARREMGVREWRDIRRSEIAKAAGVDPSSITLYEQGRSNVGEGVLERLAEFLGVSPAYLRYGIPSPAAAPAALPPMDMGEGGREFVERVRREKAAQKGGHKKRSGGRGA